MQLIPCPWCGLRAEPEFLYGGEPAARPDSSVGNPEWAAYLYGKTNEKGPHRENWCHSGGCGQWFTLHRDTVTHEVLSSRELAVQP